MCDPNPGCLHMITTTLITVQLLLLSPTMQTPQPNFMQPFLLFEALREVGVERDAAEARCIGCWVGDRSGLGSSGTVVTLTGAREVCVVGY